MKKLLTSVFLTLALLVLTTGTVFAQDTTTTTTGIVQNVILETDATTGDTTVLVTYSYTDETGATQEETVRLSVETAEGLGLVTTTTTTDPETGETLTETTVNDGVVDTEVTIDPATVIEGDTGEEEKEHPVGSALSDFFSDLLGTDYDTIMTYHENGVGFGVIAQALWLTNELDGNTETFTALLNAKQSGDYGSIVLADGSTPDNWGDVVKSLKKGDNLGSVMSGKAETDEEETPVTSSDSDSGNEQGNGSGNGNGNENANGNGNENANGNGNKDHGKPDKPGKGHGKP